MAAGRDPIAAGRVRVGMIFLPKEHAPPACEQEMERAGQGRRPGAAGWRDAGGPRHADVADRARHRAGDPARSSSAAVPTSSCHRTRSERKLTVRHPQDRSNAIQALSSRAAASTTCPVSAARSSYKGLLLADQVGSTPTCSTSAAFRPGPGAPALFLDQHLPEWPLAHPYRMGPTTAKSTPSRAATGCARAKA